VANGNFSLSSSVFHGAWQRIVKASASIAQSRQIYNQKLEVEVEKPIRDFMTTNREWSGFKTMEGNLSAIAKNIELAEEKSEKLKKKGRRAESGKVAEAANSLQSAMGEWESQAPFVFEKLQAIDELRVNQLRESLVRMQTLETEQTNYINQIMESSVQALLDINTMDEIKAFALSKMGSSRPRGTRPITRPSTGLSTPSIVTDDSVSVQSAGSAEKCM